MANTVTEYDRQQELKSFDESKAGVKGLVDSGISKVPRMFIRPKHELESDNNPTQHVHDFTVPVIDFHGIGSSQLNRKKVVSQVMAAASEVGFFQAVNHGIDTTVLDEMLSAARAFHELPSEEKKGYYAREKKRRVNYGSNFDLYQSKYANWRDTLFCVMEPNPLDPNELPSVVRDITMLYSNQVKALGSTIFELLSEALGLDPGYLKGLDCERGHIILSHYYPTCPEPELTLGTSSHSDPDFLTILLQDNLGGLQVRYQHHWIDVPYVPGAFIVNIGDLLQLVSNDVFKSVEHRVLANRVGPRVSIACFYTLFEFDNARKYGPIPELVSENNPALYRETTLEEFRDHYNGKGLDGQSSLTKFKVQGS